MVIFNIMTCMMLHVLVMMIYTVLFLFSCDGERSWQRERTWAWQRKRKGTSLA